MNRRRSATASLDLLAAALFCVPAASQVAPPLEVIDRSTWVNVRGINYLAVYPSLAGNPGSLGQGVNAPRSGDPAGRYWGAASPLAMWYFYDPAGQTAADVSTQLEWARRAGFNSVRVFLSYPLWRFYHCQGLAGVNNPFIARFRDFVDRCNTWGLYVMPVLWDSFSSRNPVYGANVVSSAAMSTTTPSTNWNLEGWHESPGHDAYTFTVGGVTTTCSGRPTSASDCTNSCLLRVAGSSLTLTNTPAEVYIQECYDAFSAHPNICLAWDVINEPEAADQELEIIITETMRILHTYNPSGPGTARDTLFSFGVSDRLFALERIAHDANCNIIGLHPYGHTIRVVDDYIFEAQHVKFGGFNFGKPVICTEVGFPGEAQSYADTAIYCRFAHQDLPSPGGTCGVGYMPWQLMIGSADDRDLMPYKAGTGLFYAATSSGLPLVRETAEVMAFVNHANAQAPLSSPWINFRWTASTLAVMAGPSPGPADPRYIAQAPVPGSQDSFSEYMPVLNPATRGITLSTATWADYQKFSSLFCALSGKINLADIASSQNMNGNQYQGTPLPGEPWILAAWRRTALFLLETWFAPALDTMHFNAWNESTRLVVDLVYGLPQGTFDPQNNTAHMPLMREVLTVWADLLHPIIASRGGPSTSCH